jgi:hypothetical protein
MKSILTTCVAASVVVGALAIASTASMAQVAVEVGPPAGPYDGGFYGPSYGYYAPYYGYSGPTSGIYGGPPSDLFDYEGPNHGAMILAK